MLMSLSLSGSERGEGEDRRVSLIPLTVLLQVRRSAVPGWVGDCVLEMGGRAEHTLTLTSCSTLPTAAGR